MRRTIGGACIILSIMIALFVFYENSNYSAVRRPFSSYTILSSSWENYKKRFINGDGRVIDYSQHSITTSEGQGYAMLRAVWSDDKVTFDRVWKWTRDTMKRPGDNLFGWRWGKNTNGTYGFISGGGDNSASDADQDIALALVFASHRWHEPSYQNDAAKILPDIWNKETALISGKRYITAGNWAANQNEVVINPSYFAPYAWRIFAAIDRKHNWAGMISPAYEVLSSSGEAPLDKSKGVGLPPDWLVVASPSGTLKSPSIPNLSTNYSFDAMRVPWRIALDYIWNKEPRAKTYLDNSFRFITDIYAHDNKLAGSYSHDGAIIVPGENPIMYSTALAFLLTTSPQLAQKMYQDKILSLYSNANNTFNNNLSYYELNWLWFGAALYNKALVPYAG